jgi:asparagine synthase (glutamine-hydrolysing)
VSGIVALVRTDGAPIDPGLIERLTEALRFRGPDARSARCIGQAALGHALLMRSPLAERECQPFTIDGNAWITADARIDDGDHLNDVLDVRGPRRPVSDPSLILRAFLRWDVACVDHLLGDFSFAVWDARGRRLVGACDHLGIRPLFYTEVGPWLVVGNAIECLRRLPDIPDELDDLPIADFLLFGHRADQSTTTFRKIRRLPPAHRLIWTQEEGLRVEQWWKFPVEDPVYCRDSDYAEQLRELLATAVSDRTRGERVSVFLSGGIDSTAVAATAVRLDPSTAESRVHGFTFVHKSLIPDDEGPAADSAARHLGIPSRQYVVDAERGWDHLIDRGAPEPLLSSMPGEERKRCHADIAEHSRIALNGEGADNALHYEWASYLAYLRRMRRWRRMAMDTLAFVRHCRRPPLLHALLQGAWRTAKQTQPIIPRWMSADLVERLGLLERWREVMRDPVSEHPVRPVAYFSLQMPAWQSFFDGFDPAYTRVPVEVCYPFLDLRVLRFLMRIPTVPWCRDKHLLRFAFRDELPRVVWRRRKTPLQGDPHYAKVRRDGLPAVVLSPRLEAYVSVQRVSRDPSSPEDTEALLRLVALSRWLAHLESADVAAARY